MKQFVLIVALCFFAEGLIAQTDPGRPNIILIVADDLGYGDVGCYGQKKIETPNIDRLAKEGLRFTQFYAGTAVCAPSRASLMTGLHTGHTPVRGNKGFEPEGQTPLPDSAITFVNLLQKSGYATGAFGKWGLGFITTTGDPQKKGFDKFYGYNCQSLAHNYYPDHLWNDHERVDLSGNLKYDSVYSSDLIHQQAMKFLEAQGNKPFFLFLPYTIPHADVFLPHDEVYDYYVKKFNEKPTDIPKYTGGEKHHFDPYPHAAFAAMVARLDKYVGEIMREVEKKGIAQNTLIIFTSDNGPHRENGGDPEFFDGNGILKGIKRDLYEGGIRVPFIAYWKGKIIPRTSEQVSAFWDLYPTFLQMANVAPVKYIDGISILPTLLMKYKQRQHEYLYWEFHENNGRQAVRWNDWKGVKLNVSKDEHAPLELYDLNTDPGEKNNVAALHPDIVKRIEEIMKEARVANKDWPLLKNENK
jgi:arylsulfatase A-like enzyme